MSSGKKPAKKPVNPTTKTAAVSPAPTTKASAVAATATSSTSAAKPADDIDSIFASAPKKPTTVASSSSSSASASSSALKNKSTAALLELAKAKKVRKSSASATPGAYVREETRRGTAVLDDDQFADSRGEKRKRKTVDGLKVYTEEELGLNNGGGDTELCPFDCNCCF